MPGGTGTYVRALVPALARHDPSLEITLFHAKSQPPMRAPERWMRQYWVEELALPVRYLYPSWALLCRPALPSSLASKQLLHAPSPGGTPPPGAGQRLVVTVHDLAFMAHPETYPKRWLLMYRAGLARAARSADAFIAVSRHTAEDLVRRTGVERDRVSVVPLAASLPRHEPGPQEVETTLRRLRVPSPYLLFVGTLEPRKNLIRLVRAYRRLAARGTPCSLVLAGAMGWSSRPLLRELQRDGPGRIVLAGFVRDGELDSLYRGASALVYPSLYEGFGLPVLEAMSRGTPCVVAWTSSLPEVAGDAAVPVDPLSLPGLTEAMERVTTDASLVERLRRAGPAQAARFSWEETARRTLEVYKSLLS